MVVHRIPSVWKFELKGFPAVLSFALLALQAAIPWTARHFVTQDGSSHLYTATVAKDLLLRSGSPYAAVYKFQPEIVPNWTTTVLLAGFSSIAGPGNAERILATLSILAGFFSIAYACRALDPTAPPWSPVINFLLHTWFLWIGFYNFYLGMALCPLALGFYLRNARSLTVRRASILSAGLVLLFFTHPIPAALTIAALVLVALWVHLRTARQAAKPIGILAAALVPALALFAIYLDASMADIPFHPDFASAWRIFPMHVFATSAGDGVRQELLYPAVLFYIFMAAVVMRRREWLSARAGVLGVTLVALALYFLVPNTAMGGDEAKVRFAWGVFIFGCILAASVRRARVVRLPLSLLLAPFLFVSLILCMKVNARLSRVVDLYASAMENIPPGATFVRLRYPTPTLRSRFGFDEAPLDPLYHMDAYVAASRRLVDLTDYQAPSGVFPIVFRSVAKSDQGTLWSLEGPGNNGAVALGALRNDLPMDIDYVVIVGEPNTPEAKATDLARVLADLGTEMRLVSASSDFLRVYRRIPK